MNKKVLINAICAIILFGSAGTIAGAGMPSHLIPCFGASIIIGINCIYKAYKHYEVN